MNPLAAVAVSMLPVTRLRAAEAFKDLRSRTDIDVLHAVLAACEFPDASRDAAVGLALERAESALAAAHRLGMAVVPSADDRYPPLLGVTVNPPPVLWFRGDLASLGKPIVAIVGSRGATPYAIDVAGRLGEELADAGIAVASGLARGVDSAAHRGCLSGQGTTVAVLGSGLDCVYPSEHEPLAEEVARKGLLLSEFGPGAAPLPDHFPLRNRIISGISLGVVVVEASEKSGSLITARFALEQGREVMAVPGNVLSGRNRGSHGLLKDGAKVVESAVDILDGLGWPVPRAHPVHASKLLQSDVLLARMEAGEVYRLDELMELTGVPGTRLLPRLMELELAGLVMKTGAGFSRT
jgi:DNA processing protein